MDKIFSTKPAMPDFRRLVKKMETIYATATLTNNGPLHNEFEAKLAEYHNVDECCLVNNATMGLMLSLRALGVSGEVITTPFSFAATTQVLHFLNLTPVFCDIHNDGPNIDATKIESLITAKTSAILATHCYGIPCDVDAIKDIADRNNLIVIYDAAHAFGQTVAGQSIFNFGDASVLSMHATKVMNSVEGGAIFAKPKGLKELKTARNFGITGEDKFDGVGANAKLSEVHAAFGLLNLEVVGDCLSKRKKISEIYFENICGKVDIMIKPTDQTNYCYFPICFSSFEEREAVYENLRKNDIYSRKYFSPLLCNDKSVLKRLLNAQELVSIILCIPIFPDLHEADALRICKIINQTVKNISH